MDVTYGETITLRRLLCQFIPLDGTPFASEHCSLALPLSLPR
jgi:hypothetical protein